MRAHFLIESILEGLIYIWDRDTGALFHSFKAQTMDRDVVMSCIGWNHAVDPFTFATGFSDGVVKIWTAKEKKDRAIPNPWVTPSLPSYGIDVLSETPFESDEHSLKMPAELA